MRAAVPVFRAVALVLLALPARAPAQQAATSSFIARILDRSTGRPVVNALVVLGSSGPSVLSDSTGTARIAEVPTGVHGLTVSSLGYAVQRLQLVFATGTATRAEVQLAPQPLPLEALHVAGTPRERYLSGVGFYERERLGGGSFIAGDALAKLAARSNQLVDAMRMMKGFKIVPAVRGTGWAVINGRGGVLGFACYPAVYVDGIYFAYGPNRDEQPKRDRPRLPSASIVNVNEIVPLASVDAIEAYPNPAWAPLEYDRNPCGVILIWTRHGPRAQER